jgi:hypothetical protein
MQRCPTSKNVATRCACCYVGVSETTRSHALRRVGATRVTLNAPLCAGALPMAKAKKPAKKAVKKVAKKGAKKK